MTFFNETLETLPADGTVTYNPHRRNWRMAVAEAYVLAGEAHRSGKIFEADNDGVRAVRFVWKTCNGKDVIVRVTHDSLPVDLRMELDDIEWGGSTATAVGPKLRKPVEMEIDFFATGTETYTVLVS